MKKLFYNIFIIVLIVSVLGYSYYKTVSENNLFEKLKKEGYITIGEITNQYSIGYNDSYYVEYKYTVNGKSYKKEVNYNYGQKFIGCDETKECIGRRFYVYYDKNNPNIAIIDFDKE